MVSRVYDDRYDRDVLAEMKPRRGPVQRATVELARGLVVEHTPTEWCGAVVAVRQGFVELEDWRGTIRSFPLNDAFLIDGKPVTLVLPKAKQTRTRTNSGSFAAESSRAKVAAPSRIFVEGIHDAELVEHVWGDDLRHEGVVVELLDGADHLLDVLREFQPTAQKRAGVLLDHLVEHSKESRIADTVRAQSWAPYVRIVGHPYIDIWQAVKPARVGLSQWPTIPRGEDWKTGITRALGLPHAEYEDIARAWRRILDRVRDFRDLEPELIGRVEELIDFVTVERHG